MGCSRGVPGLFWGVPGCSGAVPGVFRGCSGVFRGVPGCSGFYRPPLQTGVFKTRNSEMIYKVQKLLSFWEIEMIKTKSKRKHKHWSSTTIQSRFFFFCKIKDHVLDMCGCLIITLNHQNLVLILGLARRRSIKVSIIKNVEQ